MFEAVRSCEKLRKNLEMKWGADGLLSEAMPEALLTNASIQIGGSTWIQYLSLVTHALSAN